MSDIPAATPSEPRSAEVQPTTEQVPSSSTTAESTDDSGKRSGSQKKSSSKKKVVAKDTIPQPGCKHVPGPHPQDLKETGDGHHPPHCKHVPHSDPPEQVLFAEAEKKLGRGTGAL